jgi:L-2-hydroxyglutarate oxidase LhgO
MDYDVLIVGAGAVGLAIAAKLSVIGKSVLVVEKENSFSRGTSSRNSEVIHAGLYYPPQSLKAKLCIRGNKLMYEYCRVNNIDHLNIKKLVIGINDNDYYNFKRVYDNALISGVDNLTLLDKSDINKYEPNVIAEYGFISGNTGIINSHSFMKSLYYKASENNCDFAFNHKFINIENKADYYTSYIRDTFDNEYKIESKYIINSGGLYSDIIASILGIDIDINNYQLSWCKGNYYRLCNVKALSYKHLVYPVPCADFVGLGIHLTKELDGGVKFGPDTEFIEAGNENYSVCSDLITKFYDSVKVYLNNINIKDLQPDQSGIRPKIKTINAEFKDFIINDESEKGLPGIINLVGIESPGLTSSLAIAEYVLSMMKDKYDFK